MVLLLRILDPSPLDAAELPVEGEAWSVSYLAPDRLVVATSEDKVRILDPAGKARAVIHWGARDWKPTPGDEAELARRIFIHQELLLTSDPASRAFLQEQTPESKLRIKVEAATGGRAALSPDGEHLVIATTSGITRWSTHTGQLETRGPRLAACDLAFSPDGERLAVALVHGGARLLDASTLVETASLPGSVSSVAFSPDGTRLVWGETGGLVRYREVTEVTPHELTSIPEDHVVGLEFSPDGRWLALAGNRGGAYLRDLAASRTRSLGRARTLYSIGFSPDSSTVAAGAPGAVLTWDIDHIPAPEGEP